MTKGLRKNRLNAKVNIEHAKMSTTGMTIGIKSANIDERMEMRRMETTKVITIMRDRMVMTQDIMADETTMKNMERQMTRNQFSIDLHLVRFR
jgi:hypothetical protein